ncbi:UPF0764 protein C16orf89-like [Spodoptera litura]|uniref:UPF0764 protein C16orf89-like n=1 Tax=Spodoptera litura TaxID=69820 RepID=A0A9J7E628_SPOLT|nr:UPF0764 protein C16orf89-like [Spodoptera litura]
MSLWVPFEKFNLELLKRTTIYDRHQLENMYGQWTTYANSIANVLMMVPSPDESDSCVGHLEHQPIFQSTLTNKAKCNVPANCKMYLEAGSGFGYALLHRILLFVNSKYGRNCAMFSEKEDKYLTDKLCFMAYNENQYIALSDFAVPDLFGESIALCGLLGHAHFLTNFWVKSIMMHQKVDGCFMADVSKSNEDFNEKTVNETKQWSLSQGNDMLNGFCNKHMTSVALLKVWSGYDDGVKRQSRELLENL